MSVIMTMEMSLEPLISGDADEQAWEVDVANGRFYYFSKSRECDRSVKSCRDFI